MNKYTTPINSTILKNKLKTALQRLQSEAPSTGVNPNYASLEQVITSAFGVLSKFYKYLSEPSFVPVNAIKDTPPYPELYNNNFLYISDR